MSSTKDNITEFKRQGVPKRPPEQPKEPGKKSHSKTSEKEKLRAPLDIAFEITNTQFLFHCPQNLGHMRLEGQSRALRIPSELAKDWLCSAFCRHKDAEGRFLKQEDADQVLAVTKSKAVYEGPEQQVFLRVARIDPDTIAIDLGRPVGATESAQREPNIVVVDSNGWRYEC